MLLATTCRLAGECPLSDSRVDRSDASFPRKNIPLSHRPRKRFGQKCCPEWLLCGFCGVRAVRMRAVDEFADGLPFGACVQKPQPIDITG